MEPPLRAPTGVKAPWSLISVKYMLVYVDTYTNMYLTLISDQVHVSVRRYGLSKKKKSCRKKKKERQTRAIVSFFFKCSHLKTLLC